MRTHRCLWPVAGALSALLALVPVQARSLAPEAIRQVTPIVNADIRTPDHQIDHLSHFDLTFELQRDGQRVKLELEPNHVILADDATVTYVDADGLWASEPIHRHEHRVFRGQALLGSDKGRWTPAGWARITLRQDGVNPLFEGGFSIGQNKHHIELRSTYLAKKRPIDVDIEEREGEYMIVYRDTDMLRYHNELKKRSLGDSTGCAAHELEYNADLTNSIFPDGLDQPHSEWGVTPLNSLFGLTKRQNDLGGVSGNTAGVNLKSTVGDTSGCPKTKKVALIGMATDCGMTRAFQSTNSTPKAAAKDWAINIVNTASNLYEQSFNVSIGLRNLTINDPDCPTTASSALPWNVDCSSQNMTWRLNEFSKWRAQNADSNAYWTLMTSCPTGTEVGVAWMGRLCSTDLVETSGNSVSGANVVVGTQGSTWQIFAHETGHTFGAVHDCDSQACGQKLQDSSQCCPLSQSSCDANAQYIMNPYADPKMNTFSPCTIGNICSALGRNSIKSSCLSDNRGVVTYTGSQCGNGIVEAGEDCDCGGEEGCGNNSCCDAKTCKFKNNAVCDDSNDGCCNKCQFSPANTVCRPSTGLCDIEETCSGNSSTCPGDKFKDDGMSCGNGLKCASGHCTSRDYQCRSVMGTLLNTNDTWSCENTVEPSCNLVCGVSGGVGPWAGGTCVDTMQNFLDGTPCDAGGKCYGGQCKGSSVGGWIDDHKNLVIGICVGVGSLILLAILFSGINRCRAARTRRQMAKSMRPPPMMGQYPGPAPGYGPPPPRGPPPNQWYGQPNGGYPPNAYQNGPPARYS
ncbi:Disintegrin and metalloproteinase domain-containing protein B [Penicillium oxalicum]|uniref:Disintegrin and metalloproteinase domain-containing protein B n=1 Tax=Penicillium oxalicum TaxID=69781 RepID=UPI0020B7902A|nr:Disintegrin and metalloproteinase domain-containing protein B [Penicillium oxalicum]KAI2794943.1 Disintegrin and metalloproteinase domain-containing protein B [Penicillium oxalicum]